MPKIVVCTPRGKGPCSGASSTAWRAGTGNGVARPGSALDASTIRGLRFKSIALLRLEHRARASEHMQLARAHQRLLQAHADLFEHAVRRAVGRGGEAHDLAQVQ